MSKKYVISRKNLPTRLPLTFMLVVFILFDKYNVPEWVWGAVGLFFLILIISFIVSKFNEQEVDIIENQKSEKDKED